MIARLAGQVWEKDGTRVVLRTGGGVGYELLVSTVTAGLLGEEGDQADLLVSTQVREDSIQLYGFATPEERALFLLLIGVSGIGPKTALAALSATTPADLVSAVASGDVVRLTRLPGVGKKTAERLVVELRDKIERLRSMVGAAQEGGAGIRSDALAALIALGYPRITAERALQNVGADATTVQEVIKTALQILSKR